MERLQEQYNKKIAPALKEKFGFKNVMQVPKILKVVVNVGVGKFKDDKKKIDQIVYPIMFEICFVNLQTLQGSQ